VSNRQLAEKSPGHVYRVVIVEPQTPWAFDPRVLAEKNSHGVSVDVLAKRLYDYGVIKYKSKKKFSVLLISSLKVCPG
jgi:hypothetical protein